MAYRDGRFPDLPKRVHQGFRPKTEYEEVLAKSAIVRRALALAEEGL